jgi:hypothetical protein
MSIDATERYVDEEMAFRQAFQGLLQGTWTAEPGIVTTPIATDGTCGVQLAIMATKTNPDATTTLVKIPALIYCPVKFFGGGGLFLTHPVAQNDEVLVIFAKRCIDSWWQNGGVQAPLEYRLMDIHDGFCLPGVFSKPNALGGASGGPPVSQTSVQLRTPTTVLMDVSTTLITMYVNLKVNGTVIATGDITAGSGGADSVDMTMHTHKVPNVASGSGTITTTGPIAGT